MQRWSTPDLELHNQLEYISKNPELYGCRKIHDLEGPVHEVRDPKDEWIQAVLFRFIEAHKTFPPMLCGLVRRMLPPSPGGSFSSTDKPR